MATEELTITLPSATLATIKALVANGDYADIDDVIVDAIAALHEHDVRVGPDLRNQVVAAYSAYQADPANVFTSAQILARISARREEVVAAE